ncbi:MAG: DUF2892 domain-containing protein [Deltaproteobacteria bacterium]|nr:DUF2892 domain-containing protein [Deltaproteobacteria bacterium]
MNIDRMVMRLAGVFVVTSLLLSQIHTLKWLWFAAFVGANLLQASFTGYCPLVLILKRLGFKSGAAFQ